MEKRNSLKIDFWFIENFDSMKIQMVLLKIQQF